MPNIDKLINLEQLQKVSKKKQKQIDDLKEKKVDVVKSVTYSQLSTLKSNNGLVAGAYYRITDYVTTTAMAGTQSAGHQFDVIVLALSESTLSEDAYAEKHSGDTYFVNNDLTKWKLKYCLENDTTRFDWADSTNGKGVIYRMIDEHNNDLPYDFKNIQFARYKITAIDDTNYSDFVGKYFGFSGALGTTIDSTDFKYYYTFNRVESGEILENYDLSIQNVLNPSSVNEIFVKQVTIKEYLNDRPNYRGIKSLNNFVIASGNIVVDVSFDYGSHHNTIVVTKDYTYNYYEQMFRNNLIWVGNTNHNKTRECFEHNLVLCSDGSKYFSWNSFSNHFSDNYCHEIKTSNFRANDTKFPDISQYILVSKITNSDFTGVSKMEFVEGDLWNDIKCNSGSIGRIHILTFVHANFNGLTSFTLSSGEHWQNLNTENVDTLSCVNIGRFTYSTIKNTGLERINADFLQCVTLESQEISTTTLRNVDFNTIVQGTSTQARILYNTSSFQIPKDQHKVFDKIQYTDANEQTITVFTITWQEYDGNTLKPVRYISKDLGLTWELDNTYYNELFLTDVEMEALISEVFD